MKITFESQIVAEIDSGGWDERLTIQDVKELLESGNYESELIMPIGYRPTIIIKQKT